MSVNEELCRQVVFELQRSSEEVIDEVLGSVDAFIEFIEELGWEVGERIKNTAFVTFTDERNRDHSAAISFQSVMAEVRDELEHN